jgi:hypothetical protein
LNRKMMLLNAVLAGLLIFAGFQWRAEYTAAKDRERRMREAKPQPAPTAQLVPLRDQAPVLATGYNEVAQKLLLHPSRNPDLPPPPVEVPPPPPPMPALPKYHGTMNLDGKQVAILSDGNNPFEEVESGGTIGQFKLVDVNTRDITFEWRGQQVRKTLYEILAKTKEDAPVTNNAPSSSASAPPQAPVVKTQVGPVAPTNQFGEKQCDTNDSYAEGAVVNGFRKVSHPTPFGTSCSWTPVK